MVRTIERFKRSHAKHGEQREGWQSAWRNDVAPIAILVGALLLALGQIVRAPTAFAFFASLAFGSTAIVSGGIDLLLYVPLAACSMAGTVLRRIFWRDLERAFRLHWTPIVVVTLLVYGLASAFILPRLFAGATTEFVPSRAQSSRQRSGRCPATSTSGLLRVRHPRVLRHGEPTGTRRPFRAAAVRLLRLRRHQRYARDDRPAGKLAEPAISCADPYRWLLDANRRAGGGLLAHRRGLQGGVELRWRYYGRARLHVQLLASDELPGWPSSCRSCSSAAAALHLVDRVREPSILVPV